SSDLDLAGDVVNLYVFGERQYQVYAFIGLGRSLFSTNGSSGSVAIDLPSSGTYYLVSAHGAESENSAQDVRVSYRVAGIEPEFIGVGIPLIGAGTAGVGVGLWRRDRQTKRANEELRRRAFLPVRGQRRTTIIYATPHPIDALIRY